MALCDYNSPLSYVSHTESPLCKLQVFLAYKCSYSICKCDMVFTETIEAHPSLAKARCQLVAREIPIDFAKLPQLSFLLSEETAIKTVKTMDEALDCAFDSYKELQSYILEHKPSVIRVEHHQLHNYLTKTATPYHFILYIRNQLKEALENKDHRITFQNNMVPTTLSLPAPEIVTLLPEEHSFNPFDWKF